MSLINVEASRPIPMWATVRLLASSRRPISVERAQRLLSPKALGDTSPAMVDLAIKTLEDLRMLQRSDDSISLSGHAASLDGSDWSAFCSALRKAVFEPYQNEALADGGKATGSADLVRGLCWFLSLDPTAVAVGPSDFEDLQKEALIPEARPAIANKERWSNFGPWASTLGFAATALPTMGGASSYVADCTVAVRQTILETWRPDEHVNTMVLLSTLREKIPVLPGGSYSRSLGVKDPGDTQAGRSLSFALLRGQEEGWLKFEREADAHYLLHIYDPERPATPHSFSTVIVLEDGNG
ncbi:protein DpdG [Actinocorallia aurantiaca]